MSVETAGKVPVRSDEAYSRMKTDWKNRVMKALYTAAPGDYGLVDRPVPEPAPGEALVKVVRAALCHTDVIIRNGQAGHVEYPVIPGHEFSGVIESCGENVENVKPGDRVAVATMMGCGLCSPRCRAGDNAACEVYTEPGSKRDGGFAEYCAVPARHLYKIPDHLTFEEAALIEPLSNAVSAVRGAAIEMGDKVVIIGPGPIGLLAVRIAALANPSKLVLVGTRDERLALGKQYGATHTVNIRKEGGREALNDILGSGGADAVIEGAGTQSSMDLAMEIVGWRGRIAVEGIFDVNDKVDFSPYSLLLCRAVSIVGVNGWRTDDFCRALQLLSSGSVDVKPLITHTMPLVKWENAFELITTRKNEAIKVLFTF
ncbi:MAG: zinc-dependent alcohol dehydrogenase [Armatimonadota bacterium]